MAEVAPVTCDIAVLAPRRGAEAILVRDDPAGTGWQLPTARATLPDDGYLAEALAAGESLLGRRLVPLRLVAGSLDDERHPVLLIVETTALEPEPVEGFRWVEPATARKHLGPDRVRDIVEWWLERGRDGDDVAGPILRATWTRDGWFERASTWMVERLAEAGRPVTDPPRAVYLWPLAIVLRAPTPMGACFMKCAARVFASEAALTGALAERSRGAVPDVIAVEPDENWLLMADLGQELVGNGPAADWHDGFSRLAGLQRAWTDAPDALVAAGALRRPVQKLAGQLGGFLDTNGLGGRLRADVRAEWEAALPRLVAACHELDALGVPETLVHGDFHPWNVARTPTGPIVFDWSDSAIGHPFVDMPTTLVRTPDIGVRRQLADDYISAWPEVRGQDRAHAADLAMVVGALYQVQSYFTILPSLDPMESLDLDGADVSWLGRSLEALKHGIAAGRHA